MNSVSIPKSFDGRRNAPAVGGISYVSRQAPQNASTFTPGTSMFFKLPSQLKNSYIDSKSSFLKFKVVNNNTQNHFHLSAAGSSGLISDVITSCNGQVLSEISDYGTYRATQLALKGDKSYVTGQGSALHGLNDSSIGQRIKGAGNDGVKNFRTFVEPLCHLGSLFGQSKMIPLKGQALDLKIQWGDLGYNSKFGSGQVFEPENINSSSLNFIECELVLTICQLSQEGEDMLKANGPWSVLTKGVGTFHNSIPAGQSLHTLNIGSNYSQLLGTDFVFTKSAQHPMTSTDENYLVTGLNILSTTTDHLSQNVRFPWFVDNNVKKFYLTVDGVRVENLMGCDVSTEAESVAWNAISCGNLGKLSNVPSSIGYDKMRDQETSNTNVYSQSIEVFKGKNTGLGYYDEALNCSGRSTTSSVVSMQLEFDGGSEYATNFTLFSKFVQLITFDETRQQFVVAQ
jgi:hypothetical protein